MPRPDKFTGGPTDNIDAWTRSFKRWARLQRLEGQDQMDALGGLLAGAALAMFDEELEALTLDDALAKLAIRFPAPPKPGPADYVAFCTQVKPQSMSLKEWADTRRAGALALGLAEKMAITSFVNGLPNGLKSKLEFLPFESMAMALGRAENEDRAFHARNSQQQRPTPYRNEKRSGGTKVFMAVEEEEDIDDNNDNNNQMICSRLLYVDARVDSRPAIAILDTGATVSVVSTRLLAQLGWTCHPSNKHLVTASGQRVQAQEARGLPVWVRGKLTYLNALVVDTDQFDLLLGLDWMAKVKATIRPASPQDPVEMILNVTSEFEWIGNLKQRFADVFREPDCTPAKFPPLVIDTGSTRPIFVKPRRYSKAEEEWLHNHIEDLLQRGFVSPTRSGWNSPVHLVPKGEGFRMTLDAKALNAVTAKDNHPIPRPEDYFNRLQGARIFSTFDATSGYFQVLLSEESKKKTAFIAAGKHLQFERMPNGVTAGPAHFQRCMEEALRDLPFAMVYIDDVLIFSQTAADHRLHVETFLRRMRELNIRLNGPKCNWAMQSIAYLGHTISAAGISPSNDNIEAVRRMPTPKTKRDVRAAFGLFSYYRKFIPGFASLAEPLSSTMGGNASFVWGKAQQMAFDKLRETVTAAPILAYPDWNSTFLLQTDASDVGLGAVLSQLQNGQEHPIAFGSRVLNSAERNYCAVEKEALAIKWAIEKFRHYLHRRKYLLLTDNSALSWLLSSAKLSPKLNRWAATLTECPPIGIKHRPGTSNGNADGLSRLPMDVCEDTDTMLLLQLGVCPQSSKGHCKKVVNRASRFELQNGHLVNLVTNTIVPEIAARKQLILDAHAAVAHGDVKKTMDALRTQYSWKGMWSQCRQVLSECVPCQAINVRPPEVSTMTSPQVDRCFQRVACDTAKLDDGTWIVVAVDYGSRWVEARVIPSHRPAQIVAFLEEDLLARHGCPEEIITDNGGEFRNHLLEGFCHDRGITLLHSPTNHPRSNGLAERTIRTLKEALRKAQMDAERQGSRVSQKSLLPQVLQALRGRWSEALGCSPAEVLYKRPLRMPFQRRTEVEGEVRAAAAFRPHHQSDAPYLELGTQVLLRPATGEDRWTGPYAILERDGHRYRLEIPNRRRSSEWFAREHLRVYIPPSSS